MAEILPTIGSAGYYELRTPLNTLITVGERYTCQAIRRISDYLANNEDVKTDVYTKLAIVADYDLDLENDAHIVSLQSDKGHWLYVPASYIVGYPLVNGIPYRTVMIGISLPSMPADRDLTFLETDLANVVSDSLGVIPVIRQVETSRVVLVSSEAHEQTQMDRTMLSANRVTDRTRFMTTQQELTTALAKIAELELYIKNNFIA